MRIQCMSMFLARSCPALAHWQQTIFVGAVGSPPPPPRHSAGRFSTDAASATPPLSLNVRRSVLCAASNRRSSSSGGRGGGRGRSRARCVSACVGGGGGCRGSRSAQQQPVPGRAMLRLARSVHAAHRSLAADARLVSVSAGAVPTSSALWVLQAGAIDQRQRSLRAPGPPPARPQPAPGPQQLQRCPTTHTAAAEPAPPLSPS